MTQAFVLVLFFLLAPAVHAGEMPAFEGLIEPREVVNFGSKVPGILEKVYVERGDRVSTGQVLARLKSGVEAAALRSAEAKVDFGQRKSQRNEELTKKKLISVHEKDEIETELQLARLQVSEAREQLELRVIRSTVDGVVVKRTGAPGGYVAGTLPDRGPIDPLNVELVIPVQFIGAIKEGMTAKILPDDPWAANTKPGSSLSTRSSTRPAALSACAWNCPTRSCPAGGPQVSSAVLNARCSGIQELESFIRTRPDTMSPAARIRTALNGSARNVTPTMNAPIEPMPVQTV
jgi:pyruvate/2-oxoglutarate dehydrogenase complex dihydrolipoamide acyltransferase (E2) component